MLAAFIIGCIIGCLAYRFMSAKRDTAPAARAEEAAQPAAPVRSEPLAASSAPVSQGSDDSKAATADPEKAAAAASAMVAGLAAGAGLAGKGASETSSGSTDNDQSAAPSVSEPEDEASSMLPADSGEPVLESAEPSPSSQTMSEEEVEAALAALPKDASSEDKADAVGTRPATLTAERGGAKDNLQRIKGIGKVNETKLNALGIFHFDQIAQWTPAEARWVSTYLAFKGRIEREDWIGQAKTLAAGEETEFAKRVDAGEVETSKPKQSKKKKD